MKRRTLAGCCGVGVFVIALVTVCVAFATPSWLVSDYRITGAKLDRLGLWTHCFRSLPDVNDDYQRRFFVGCRWVYDPFTKGYDEIRGFLIPGMQYNEHGCTEIEIFPFFTQFRFYDSNAIFLHNLFDWYGNFLVLSIVILPMRWPRSKTFCSTDKSKLFVPQS